MFDITDRRARLARIRPADKKRVLVGPCAHLARGGQEQVRLGVWCPHLRYPESLDVMIRPAEE